MSICHWRMQGPPHQIPFCCDVKESFKYSWRKVHISKGAKLVRGLMITPMHWREYEWVFILFCFLFWILNYLWKQNQVSTCRCWPGNVPYKVVIVSSDAMVAHSTSLHTVCYASYSRRTFGIPMLMPVFDLRNNILLGHERIWLSLIGLLMTFLGRCLDRCLCHPSIHTHSKISWRTPSLDLFPLFPKA